MGKELRKVFRDFDRMIACWLLSMLVVVYGYDITLAEDPIVIAAGETQGNYSKLANAISQMALPANHIQVLNTGGSVENVNLLQTGKADFAVVQSDVAQRALRGHQPFQDPIATLALTTPLFTEFVHILVRSELFIFTTSGLRGKRVALGPGGSGTAITARAILDASEAGAEEVQAKYLAMDRVNEELRNETIDIAFLTSALPSSAAQAALTNGDARLLFIEPKIIERLANTGSFVEARVPKTTYPNLGGDVATIGVQALLLTRRDISSEKIQTIARLLRNNAHDIEERSGLQLDLLWHRVPLAASLGLHPLTAEYFQSNANALASIALIITLVGFCLLLLYIRVHIRKSLAKHGDVLLAAFTLIALWALASIGLYHYENNLNENFSSLSKSLWSVLVYVSGGFESRKPITNGGEVVAVLVVVLGVAAVAWFVAELAGRFVHARLKDLKDLLLGRSAVPISLQNHLVIINWDHRTEHMIQQLTGQDIEQPRAIVVITKDPVRFPSTRPFHNCFNVCGDACKAEVLSEARVVEAHSTILSTWINSDVTNSEKLLGSDAADMKTILTILAIRNLPRSYHSLSVSITAELKSMRHFQSARDAGRDAPTEIVCSEQFAADILTQCAVTPGLAQLYNDLLTFAPNTDEIHKIRLPPDFEGAAFADIVVACAQRAEKNTAVLPIGICRDSVVHLNPGTEIDPLRTGDDLFVISDSPTALKNHLSARPKRRVAGVAS